MGIAGLRGMNFIFPGMQIESDYYFAGFTSFKNRVYFPSRINNLMYYPYINFSYKNIPIDIFDSSHKIASYHDRSLLYGAGIGFLPLKYLNTQIEYNQEYMNVSPIIALPDTSMFPTWKEELHQIRVLLDLDYLDDVQFPKEGVLVKARYESSLQRFGSDIDYTQWEILVDFYHTFSKKHTVGYHFQHGDSELDLPRYKYFTYGGPKNFVGMDWNEFQYFRTSIFRLDYMYKFKKNLYVKLIGNCAPNYNGNFYPIQNDILWGYGIGLSYWTPVGPIELVFSRGDKIVLGADR